MSAKAKVAIIGRPNVGKSTLFNIISNTRKAVVKDQPGVTRDIIIEPAEAWGKVFEIIDTGGLTESQDLFSKLIRTQVLELLENIDLLLVVADGRVGLIPEDRDLIRIASESGKPFLLVINKVDSDQDIEAAKSDFYEFNVEMVVTSFERRRGIDEVLEWIRARVSGQADETTSGPTIAIVGKPNVGKSSLCNYLLGFRRMLVSEVAGTTVDAVDADLLWEGKPYRLVDTAGLRKSNRQDDVEIISTFKTRSAIARSEVVLLMVDGPTGLSEQDAKILSEVLAAHKAVILVANKSDLGVRDVPAYRQWFREQLADEIHFFVDIPVAFISAKTGAGIKALFEQIEDIYHKLHMRIPTSHLNDFFMDVIRQAPAPVWGTKNVKFYYLTQTYQTPPSFIAFANHPEGVTPAYRRFLAKRIQERFELEGVPIRIFVMRRRSARDAARSQ